MLKKFWSSVVLRYRSLVHGPKVYREMHGFGHPYAMTLQDFIDTGFMQELNRIFLHPAGVHLFFTTDKKNNPTGLGPIVSYRGEKMAALCFPQKELDPAKADRVASILREYREFRFKALGYFTQPSTLRESYSDSTE